MVYNGNIKLGEKMHIDIFGLVAIVAIWITSMIHMYKSGSKTGFSKGNMIGVSSTLSLLESSGVLDKEGYEKVFKVMKK